MLTQLSLRIQRYSDIPQFDGLLIHFNYLVLCVYMSVPICVHVCMGVCMRACMHASTCALWKSKTDKEYLSKFFTLFVRRGYLKLEVTVWPDSLASRSPDTLISVSQHWEYRELLLCPEFYIGTGGQSQALMDVQHILSCLICLALLIHPKNTEPGT